MPNDLPADIVTKSVPQMRHTDLADIKLPIELNYLPILRYMQFKTIFILLRQLSIPVSL